MQYHAIPCNTMQYHGTLLTADGAYHCPVGSIMAIFIFNFDYWSCCHELRVGTMKSASLTAATSINLREFLLKTMFFSFFCRCLKDEQVVFLTKAKRRNCRFSQATGHYTQVIFKTLPFCPSVLEKPLLWFINDIYVIDGIVRLLLISAFHSPLAE